MSKKAQRKALAAAKKGKAPVKVSSPAAKPATAPLHVPAVQRPFEGLDHEVEIAAMRELIPAASLKIHTTKEFGDTDAYLVSVAPDQVQGMVTKDGRILVGLQTQAHSQDAGHDIALVLSKLIGKEPGTAIDGLDVRQAAPKLTDMIASESDFAVHRDFGFWMDPNEELTPEVTRALESSAEAMVPTRPIEGVRGAFWCRMNHQFVRWVRPEDETAVLNALARLSAQRKASILEDSRCIGAFRLLGMLCPVWQFDDDSSFEEICEGVASFGKVFTEAINDTTALTAQERRARDGLISRQVSLR